MFEHLVIFKFNSAITKEHEQVLLSKLQGLKQTIPGIIALTAGLNVTEETDNIHGFSLGLRVTFESQEALREYGPHPSHQDFVKALDGVLDSVVVVDYPIA